MGKSLKELFTILCEAPSVPVSPAEYRNALSGARGKVKNSGGISTDAPTQHGVKKKMEANLEVNGQGETPLSKVFKAPRIANAGTTEGALAGWLNRKGQAEALSRQASAYGKGVNEGGTGTHALAAEAHDQAAKALHEASWDAMSIPAVSQNNLSGARSKLTQMAKEHELSADDHRQAVERGNLPVGQQAGAARNIREHGGLKANLHRSQEAPHHPDHPPIKNAQANWMYHAPTETYSAERSELEHANRQDPWNRPLVMRYMKQHDDSEGEATHWTGTVQAPPKEMGTLGKSAKLQIFND